MPPPKRTKIVSAHARAQAAPAVKSATPNARAAASRAHPTANRRTSSSSNATGIGHTLKRRTRPRSFARQDGVEIVMSGGLDVGDVRGATLDEENKLSQSSRGPVQRMSRTSSSRPALADISSDHNANQSSRNTVSKKRLSAPRTSPWQDGQEPALLDDGFEEYLRSSSPHLPMTVISRPPSASKVQGTPSFLSITNFKRRPRQPSILRMVQQKVGTDVEHASGSEPDVTLAGIGNSPNLNAATQSSLSSKRKASALETDDEIPSPEQEVRDSTEPSRNVRLSSFPSTTAPEEDEHEDSDAEGSGTSPDLPPVTRSHRSSASAFKKTPPTRRRGRRIRPKHAQPKPAASPSPPISDTSPRSTPPSTHDNQTNNRAAKRQKAAHTTHRETITTASLHPLLPRRRTRDPEIRQNSAFDMTSSSDSTDEDEMLETIQIDGDDETERNEHQQGDEPEDDDEDELTKPQPTGRSLRARPTREQSLAKTSKTDHSRAQKSVSKTYSRRKQSQAASSDSAVIDSQITLSDGEDEEGVRRAGGKAAKGNTKAPKTQELADAAKKFREVDDWELSFESVDVGGGSSSPWR